MNITGHTEAMMHKKSMHFIKPTMKHNGKNHIMNKERTVNHMHHNTNWEWIEWTERGTGKSNMHNMDISLGKKSNRTQQSC